MKTFRPIFKYLKGQQKNFILYTFFTVLSVLFSFVSLSVLGPFMQVLFGKEKTETIAPELTFSVESLLDYLKYIVGSILQEKGPVQTLLFICILIIVSIFFKNLFLYLAFRIMSPMRNMIMTKMRASLFHKVLELPISYFTEQRKGDIISRISNDTSELEWSVIGTMEGLIREPLTILIFILVLVWLSPTLSILMFVLLPLMGFLIGKVSKSLKKTSSEAQEKLGIIMSILDETLSGLRIIKIFNAETIVNDKFSTVNDRLNQMRNQINFRRDLASPVSEFLGVFVLCVILFVGGYWVLSKKVMAPDAFITYILTFTQIINPAKSLSSLFASARRGGAAIERIEAILDAPVSVVDNPNGLQLASLQNEIVFKDVNLSFGETKILDNINLTIKRGQTVALVGSSGAGKSTLVDLLPRFYDVDSGSITIDGKDIKAFTLHSLREKMSMVTQEPVLFNDTIFNNIALKLPNSSQEAVEAAAKIANAHHFISQKEQGYQTNIGDRGSKLSGGERQRLTIARAVLSNPELLILDEATSALDTESEKLVQDALNNALQNRTSIIIAHRLSTIRNADVIVVMQKGRIVEQGTHETLLSKDGFYSKLVRMQEIK
jgi:ATP-binding cassette, subfamily B, bacterial MsbA